MQIRPPAYALLACLTAVALAGWSTAVAAKDLIICMKETGDGAVLNKA